MPGMGLSFRKCRDVHEPSSASLEHLEEVRGAASSRNPEQVVLSELQHVQEVAREDPVTGFRLLETLDIFLDEDNDLFAAVPSSTKSAMVAALYAAWVTVVRGLQAAGELNASSIPNYKYVLRRAIESADALNQECEGDAVGGAPEALQTALDGAGEEEEEEEPSPAADGSAEFSAALATFANAVGAPPGGAGRGRGRGMGMGMYMGGGGGGGGGAGGVEGETQDEDDEDDDDLDPEDDGDGEGEGQQMYEEASALRGLLTERLPPTDGSDGAGRLVALDNPRLRIMLLRTVGRLTADDPLRQEVESEVGGAVDSETWTQALAEAEEAATSAAAADAAGQQQGVAAAAAAAGIGGGSGGSAGGAGAGGAAGGGGITPRFGFPSLDTGGSLVMDGFDEGVTLQSPAVFAPGGGLLSPAGSLVPMLQGVPTGPGGGMGLSMGSGLISMAGNGSLTGLSGLVGAGQGTMGTADGGDLGDEGLLGRLLQQPGSTRLQGASSGFGADLQGDGEGSGLDGMGGGGEGSGFDGGMFLAGDEDEVLGGEGGEDGGYLGDGAMGKRARTGSLLPTPRQPSKLSRMS